MGTRMRNDYFKITGDLVISLNDLLSKRGLKREGTTLRLEENEVGFFLAQITGTGARAETVRTSSVIGKDRKEAAQWLKGYVAAAYHFFGDPGHSIWE